MGKLLKRTTTVTEEVLDEHEGERLDDLGFEGEEEEEGEEEQEDDGEHPTVRRRRKSR